MEVDSKDDDGGYTIDSGPASPNLTELKKLYNNRQQSAESNESEEKLDYDQDDDDESDKYAFHGASILRDGARSARLLAAAIVPQTKAIIACGTVLRYTWRSPRGFLSHAEYYQSDEVLRLEVRRGQPVPPSASGRVLLFSRPERRGQDHND